MRNVGILREIQECYKNADMSLRSHAYYGIHVCGKGVCSVMGDVVLLCGFWHVFEEATIVWGFHAYYGIQASHIRGFMHMVVVEDTEIEWGILAGCRGFLYIIEFTILFQLSNHNADHQ